MIIGTIYKIDGEKIPVKIPKKNRLKFLQGAVGGYIEIVTIKTDKAHQLYCDIVINEEGLLRELPLNPFKFRCYSFKNKYLYFYGDVVVVNGILN